MVIQEKISLLTNSPEEISCIFTLVSNLLKQYYQSNSSLLLESVELLFDVVFKGYHYPFIVNEVSKLYEIYASHPVVFNRFDQVIPTVFQNALLTAINNDDNADPVCHLICNYLFSEGKFIFLIPLLINTHREM